MSHATGRVFIGNLVAAWFEYDGTTDFAYTRLYGSGAELSQNWRSGAESECTCGTPPAEVMLHCDYADGYHWPGKVCFNCMAIVEGRKPWNDDDETDEWPKDGYPPSGEGEQSAPAPKGNEQE